MAEYIEQKPLLEKCHWVIRSDGTRVYVCHAEDIETAPAIDIGGKIMGNWVPVTSSLPRPEEEVCLFCKTKYGTYQCQGFYIPEKMDAEESEFTWDWEALEYDEENDANYVHSGWYERIHNWDDYSTVGIDDEVLYWMPLPENPEGWDK